MNTAYRLEKATISKPTINRGSTITGRFGAIILFSLAAMSVASCGGGDGGGSGPPPSDQMRIEPPQPESRLDLVIEATSVSNDALTPGQQFTLSVTVRNLGSGRAPATTLRYKSHAQLPIVTSDPTIGTAPVTSLGPSETFSESISLTAPSDAGTYYYGACVDEVRGESDTDNNCSGDRAARIVVSPRTGTPSSGQDEWHIDVQPGQLLPLQTTPGDRFAAIYLSLITTPLSFPLYPSGVENSWADSRNHGAKTRIEADRQAMAKCKDDLEFSERNSRITEETTGPLNVIDCFPILSFANECGFVHVMEENRSKRITIRTGLGPTIEAARDAAERACSVAVGRECESDFENDILSYRLASSCAVPPFGSL